jgi:hypothetical protein
VAHSDRRMSVLLSIGASILLLPVLAASQQAPDAVASAAVGNSTVTWQAAVNWSAARLTVLCPGGRVVERTFRRGEPLELQLADLGTPAVADGAYTYELRFTPPVDADTRARLATARAADDVAETVRTLRDEGLLPAGPLVRAGTFRVVGGSIVPPDLTESPSTQPTLAAQAQSDLFVHALDQVIADDLIVQGSACVGLDCVNNESFGFDTLRLKENNTRIAFNDTSSTASFPTEDWRLRANESANGGKNAFFIDDMGTTSTGDDTPLYTPFTIEAGAPTGSIYVTSNGRVGLGTSTPALKIETVNGDTPGIRLHQDGSGGFNPQTWDVAGNEANFFVRDVTNGSHLPFRIRPGAPTSSIDIAASGDVGIGTASPTAKLDVDGDEHVGGNITVPDGATVDGRDVSADGAALSALETMIAGFQAGVVPASGFAATRLGPSPLPLFDATVTLSVPLESYSVVVTPVGTDLTTNLHILAKTRDHFVIATSSITNLVEVDWQVLPTTVHAPSK